MTLLSEYYVPGLHIEDRSIKVPLDWTGHEPGHGFDGESISLFYRVVTAPEHVHDDLPLLIFLQGGPGGAGPRRNREKNRPAGNADGPAAGGGAGPEERDGHRRARARRRAGSGCRAGCGGGAAVSRGSGPGRRGRGGTRPAGVR